MNKNNLILENEPGVVIEREKGWSGYSGKDPVEMVHGQSLCLNPECDYSKKLYCYRRQQFAELLGLARFDFRRSDGASGVCVDVGANIGYVSSWLAMRQDVQKIFSIEPAKKTYEYLKRNAELYPEIHPNNIALGAQAGMVCLNESEVCSAHNSVVQLPDSGSSSGVKVESLTLDSLLDGEMVEFIKIDVEGGETDVVLGGMHTIQVSRPLLMVEFMPDTSHVNRQGLIDFWIKFVTENDYKLYFVDPRSFIMPISASELEGFSGDLFVIPNEKRWRR